MAQLVLPFHEALDIAASQRPFPEQVEAILCEDDTIHVTINAESVLPKLLRAVSPRLRLALRFVDYEDGVATFDIGTSLFSLPATKVVTALLGLFPAPELDGIRIDASGPGPKLRVEVNRLLARQVRGVEVTEFYLHDNDFIVVADIRNFTLPKARDQD